MRKTRNAVGELALPRFILTAASQTRNCPQKPPYKSLPTKILRPGFRREVTYTLASKRGQFRSALETRAGPQKPPRNSLPTKILKPGFRREASYALASERGPSRSRT